MPSRDAKWTLDKAVAVIQQEGEEEEAAPPPPPRARASRLPAPLRFPLLVVLSLTLSSLLYSLAAGYTAAAAAAGELARVSRALDRWPEVGVLVGWRTFELGLGWFGDYDGYDLAALSLLSHGPPLYLLAAFYNVPPAAVVSSLLIDTLTTYVPFRLLRPLSPAHKASRWSGAADGVPNRNIVTDFSVQTYTTLLASAIYSVTLYSSYASYLPVYLVTYFANIPSVAAAHSATLITLIPLTLPLGVAAKSFIFTPAAAAWSGAGPAAGFDPVTATLGETFWYNIWGYGNRTKVVINRTAALMLVSGVNTFIQTLWTIEGVEATGAAAYAGVWVAAAGITGIAFGVVGAV